MTWSTFALFLARRTEFATTYRTKSNKSSTRGLNLEMSVLARARALLLNMLTLVHTWAYHMEKISRRLFYIYRIWYHLWVELRGWMGSVSHGLGADLSLPPCLSVTTGILAHNGEGRCLSSQKRPTGRNLGGNRLVRCSGTTSRGNVVLVFCLRMRRFSLTLVLTIFVVMKWIV